MKDRREIELLTTNLGKFKIAKDFFASYGLEIKQLSMDTPEIQSLNNAEVAQFSVEFAGDGSDVVIRSDVGYFIPALNNFPGPLVKFINQCLSPEDILATKKQPNI